MAPQAIHHFDGIQYAPELFPYIKERVDDHRNCTGQFILTGAQNLLPAEKITESLAGRAAVLRLFPLTHREVINRPLSLRWGLAMVACLFSLHNCDSFLSFMAQSGGTA